MANKLRGQVRLPDTELVLRYTINAICEFESEWGEDFIPLIERLDQSGHKPSFRLVRALVWAGLRDGTPDVTILQAGEILDTVGIAPALMAVTEAIQAAFGVADNSGKNLPSQNG